MRNTDIEALDDEVAMPQAAWRRFGLLCGIAVVATFLLMWDALTIMVNTWWVSSTFQYVLLILPVVGWLVWQRSAALSLITPRPFKPGLFLVFGAAILWFAGFLGDVTVVQQFAMIFMLQALTLTLLGVGVAHALLFPLVYMILLVPFGEGIIPVLQDITAHAVVKGLRLLDIPVFLDGTMLMIPSGNFTVAEACSGVRYLISTVVLGALFANIAFKSWKRRLIIMMVSIVMPIAANAVRAFGIVYVAYLTDNEYAAGVDHIVYGWVFFAIVTLLLLVIGISFADRPVDDQNVDMAKVRQSEAYFARFSGGPRIAFGVFAILGAVAVYAHYVSARAPEILLTQLNPVSAGSEWPIVDNAVDDWRPRYKGADVEVFEHFGHDGNVVSLYRARFNNQTNDIEMITYGNTAIWPKKQWDRAQSGRATVNWGGQKIDVITHQINGANGIIRDVWQVYWVNDKIVASETAAKVQFALARMFGGNLNAGTVIVSAPQIVQARNVYDALETLTQELPPIGKLLTDEQQSLGVRSGE